MQLHCHSFLLLLIKLIDFSYKTAFPPFYCIISPHPRKLGTNRAVGTSRSRYRAYRRHRCRRYGVRERLRTIAILQICALLELVIVNLAHIVVAV